MDKRRSRFAFSDFRVFSWFQLPSKPAGGFLILRAKKWKLSENLFRDSFLIFGVGGESPGSRNAGTFFAKGLPAMRLTLFYLSGEGDGSGSPRRFSCGGSLELDEPSSSVSASVG